MGLRELPHLSHGVITMCSVTFSQAERPFALTSKFLPMFQMARAPGALSFTLHLLSMYRLVEGKSGLETSLVATEG